MTKSARDSATDILTPSLPLPIPSPATPTLSPSSPNLITVLPASPSDLPLLAQLQRKAFATSSVDLLIFPDVSEADHLSHWVDRMARAIDDPFKAVGKAVDAQGTTVGMALWETPKRAEHKGNKEERKWPFGPNLELAEELFSQRRDPEASGVSQYHLSVHAVDPARQRRGAGRALMKWGCRKADEEGVIMTLKGTQVAVPLYESFGFRQNRPPVTADQGQISLLPMLRSAHSTQRLE